MSQLLFLFFSLIISPVISSEHAVVQKPDFLVLEKDTIFLNSFPLEYLNFQQRPFKYGYFYFPNSSCWRGYQATWEVIDRKLFLIEIARVDASREKIDLIAYFAANNYTPTIINGKIFADWFTADLKSYPRDFGKWSCNFKSYKCKRFKSEIRFENGVMVFNKYKSRKFI